MLNDKLFMRTGIEMDHLDIAFGVLKLETDEEYLTMLKEFDEAVALIHKNAKERDGVTETEASSDSKK